MENEKCYCKKCGNKIDVDAVVCPICNASQISETKKNNKGKILCVALIAVIVVIVCWRLIWTSNSKREYKENYINTVDEMYNGAAEAEKLCVLIHDVWYNTIFEVDDYNTNQYTKSSWGFNDDFNTSLNALMSSSEYISALEKLNTNQKTVMDMMSRLKNPPDEYKQAYSTINSFYTEYLNLVNLAISPSGNLTSYTDDYREADDNTAKTYKDALSAMDD